jgi:hypothetical protein
MQMRSLIAFSVLFLSFLLWEIFTREAWAQAQDSAGLIEAAKKEGQLNWYTSMSVGIIQSIWNCSIRNTLSSK